MPESSERGGVGRVGPESPAESLKMYGTDGGAAAVPYPIVLPLSSDHPGGRPVQTQTLTDAALAAHPLSPTRPAPRR
ncbi:hypothetical protein SVIO_040260 [Streptomyces violaceusniger]|uniref:Uncharacterized protein n=1 Tax=Streptomyces violaceusniger TaxID=68280 RepID=A0A4D4L5X1_STRVO|nr:hypothetical protein SVIO_040260 [Streptomyces violaceusniger]